MPDFVLREPRAGDAYNLASIIATELGYPVAADLVARNLRDILARDDQYIRVAAEAKGDTVIGYAHCETYRPLYTPPLGNLLALAVVRAWQRRGVGTALVHATEDWLKGCGYAGLRINSGSARTGAHAFYRAQGYEQGKTQYRFLKEFR